MKAWVNHYWVDLEKVSIGNYENTRPSEFERLKEPKCT